MRVQVLADIACGLAYMHSQFYVHRDIKVSYIYSAKWYYLQLLGIFTQTHNILLSVGCGGYSAKIADFGSAVICAPGEFISEEIGTSGYTAPEVFVPGKYNCSADTFSFAIVQWETLNTLVDGVRAKDHENPLCGKDPYDAVEMVRNISNMLIYLLITYL
jgi:serine/threonine protein kinase